MSRSKLEPLGPKLEPLGPLPRPSVSPPTPAHGVPEDAPRLPRRHWGRWAALLGALAATIAGAVLWMGRGPAPARYVTAPIERGSVSRVTTASGMINPVETVQVGSYVSGRIQELLCDYNSKVVKGQSCAKIEARNYEATVQQAAAAAATAKAQLAKDEANLVYARLVYQRNLQLSQRNVVAQDTVDKALSTQQQAQAQVEVDRAVIEQREAELLTARVNLDYTNIISPIDGTVVSRNVSVGQTVAAAFQTPTLFLIATDLTRMQVDANVTEAAIGEVSEGQKATFTVEAFPDRTFAGTVTQVRQAPISVQNVISYVVVIEVDNADLQLKPGMTATAHIILAERDGVMRVPESALRFTPAPLAAGHTATNRRQDPQEAGVWVDRSGGLTRIPVTLGVRGENYVEVTSGAFEPEDRVVIGRERAGGSAADRAQVPAQRL